MMRRNRRGRFLQLFVSCIYMLNENQMIECEEVAKKQMS